MKTFGTIILVVAIVILACAISFGITSALVYGVCWAFNFTFSWKIALGIWFLMALLRSVFKVIIKKEEN